MRTPWYIIALLILFIFLFFANEGRIDEYTDCVDDCVNDISSCGSYSQIYDNQRNAYIKEEDTKECISRLESCTSSCKHQYGN